MSNHLNSGHICIDDTIDLMRSDDAAQRFAAEYIQVVIRVKRLEKRLTERCYNPSVFVYTQYKIMKMYERVLEMRADADDIPLPGKEMIIP